MPATYEPIATTTLGSAASSITFSSIPGTYTDLRLVLVTNGSTGSVGNLLRFNSDTGTNYSYTTIYADGTAPGSVSETNLNRLPMDGNFSASSTVPNLFTTDIFSYAGSTNKTCLGTMSKDTNSAAGILTRTVGLWRSTAAITSVTITSTTSSTYSTGTTATLYGILKA